MSSTEENNNENAGDGLPGIEGIFGEFLKKKKEDMVKSAIENLKMNKEKLKKLNQGLDDGELGPFEYIKTFRDIMVKTAQGDNDLMEDEVEDVVIFCAPHVLGAIRRSMGLLDDDVIHEILLMYVSSVLIAFKLCHKLNLPRRMYKDILPSLLQFSSQD